MEAKKTPEANLENRKSFFFFVGLVAALAIVCIAFEWSLFEGDGSGLAQMDIDDEEEEMIPITQQEYVPPPPPPPQPTQIEIVEDDEEIEDDMDIEETDINEDTEIEIVDIEEVNEEPEVFIVVEDMPTFPGCEKVKSKKEREKCADTELRKYLGRTVKYPAMAKDAGISGRVYVNFVVMEDGRISKIKLLKGIGGGCDEEAMRVVKKMPRWNPGKQRGRNVRVSYNLPINFVLR